jgi:branched-chain amino acid aminotransferase
MKEYCYLNGKILPIKEAKIPATDIGVLRGYAIFDSIAAVKERIIFFDEHYRRFVNSAKIMRLKIPISKHEIKVAIEKLLRKNKCNLSKIRVVLTGGEAIGSLDYNRHSANFFILVQEMKLPNPRDYTQGIKLITCEHQREIPRAKSNGYVTAVNVQPLRRQAGATEILYTFKDKILEATTSNIFIIRGNKLITPKEDILIGIVRNKVIGLARKFMKVEERELKVSELKTADEAFITSTFKKVLPVVCIDKAVIGNGKVGLKTKLLMGQYARLERNEES